MAPTLLSCSSARTMLSTAGSTGTANLPPAPNLAPDLAVVKQAIGLVRQHKSDDATTLAISIKDPAAQKLVEWLFLRDADSPAGFDRYDAFIQANPDWPSIPLLRRRAEARLWHEQCEGAATLRRFVGCDSTRVVGPERPCRDRERSTLGLASRTTW
jgi:peptidoglycan lytic transglycosylase